MAHFRCLLLMGLITLSGCTPDPGDALFERYLAAIAGPEARAAMPAADAAPPRYPRPRARDVEVPEVRGGVLELFSLSRCDVSQFIAQRNSILGRHADSASHVALGGAIMQRLRTCRAQVDPEDDLQARLDDLISAKQPALRALRWNASFGSRPFAQWWSLSAQPVAPDTTSTAPTGPIKTLRAALDAAGVGDVEEAQLAFSEAYQRLEASEAGGAWLLAAQRATTALDRATALLNVPADGPCSAPRKQALSPAYRDLYRGQIAPHVRTLEGHIRAMSDALEALWALHASAEWSPPEAVAAFRKRVWYGPDSMAHQLQQARRRHEASWQDRLRACDIPSD